MQRKYFLSYVANIEKENLEKKYENLINKLI